MKVTVLILTCKIQGMHNVHSSFIYNSQDIGAI